MTKYEYRFLTRGVILNDLAKKDQHDPYAFQSKKLDGRIEYVNFLRVTLDKFNEVGDDGWIYCGQFHDENLPYGSIMVFSKPLNKSETVKEPILEGEKGIISIDTQEVKDVDDTLDDIKLSDELSQELVASYEKEAGDDMRIRMNKSVAKEREKIMEPFIKEMDKKHAEIADERAKQREHSESEQLKRMDLYKEFESTNGKNAMWHGKETTAFKEWLNDR